MAISIYEKNHPDYLDFVYEMEENYKRQLMYCLHLSEKDASMRASMEIRSFICDREEGVDYIMFSLVDDDTGKVIGMLILVPNNKEKSCFGYNLYITPAYQGKNLLRRLVRHLGKYLKDNGYVDFYMHVFSSNMVAFKIYQRLGFNVRSYFMGLPVADFKYKY